jgi:hypothetical protein
MNLILDNDKLAIRFKPIQKLAGLTGDIVIPLKQIQQAEVDATPMQSIRGRLLMGLRVPRTYYLARTLSKQRPEYWALTDRRPALRILTRDGRRITASADDPAGLVAQITKKLG